MPQLSNTFRKLYGKTDNYFSLFSTLIINVYLLYIVEFLIDFEIHFWFSSYL